MPVCVCMPVGLSMHVLAKVFIFRTIIQTELKRTKLLLLNSILKSRDITLSTKVHLVKAVVFPVVMYGCESWTTR